MKRNVKQNNRSVGAVYEQAAGYYLEQNGYELIEYNYRCRDGEIDIKESKKRFFGVRCTIRYSMELKMRSAALM